MSFIQEYGFIIGGVIFLLTALLRRTNATQMNQYINTINMLRVDMAVMKKESSDKIGYFEAEFNLLRDELHDKDKLVSLLEATSWDLPFPYWLKDMQGKMIYINSEYEKKFRLRSIDYVGKNDADIWGDEVAERFKANDRIVIESDNEYIIDENELEGYVVIKWKRRAGNIIIGVAGMCMPSEFFTNYRLNNE